MCMCAGPATGTYQSQILKENWPSHSSYQLLTASQSAVGLWVLPVHADEVRLSPPRPHWWGETESSPSTLMRLSPPCPHWWDWVLPIHTGELPVFLLWYESCARTTSTEFMDTKVQSWPEDTISRQSSNLTTLFRVDVPWKKKKNCN